MKRIILFIGFSLLCLVINAQSPYYYYYEDKKQYLTLDTEHAFFSLKEANISENPAPPCFLTSGQMAKRFQRYKRLTTHSLGNEWE
jgi:hypothetical protein